jgi:hypothetical protein
MERHRPFSASFARRSGGLAVLTLACLTIGAATANEPPKLDADVPPAAVRYSMTPVDGGFLRMDTDSGTVSLCAKKGDTWACETVPDDYKALQQENETLKRKLAQARRDGDGTAKSGSKFELPSEEDVDKAISQMDKYIRKFRGLLEKYQGAEQPGRT